MAVLGELLGRHDQQPLMEAYIQKLDCRGLRLDTALRALLSGFRLPGEAQKIDRILDAFAKHWHKTASHPPLTAETGSSTSDAAGSAGDGPTLQQKQPESLSAETAFVVCFALIMLNTDAHNPAVKKRNKMTLAAFCSNLRGVGTEGADLPSAWLAELYEGISKNEIKLKGECRTAGPGDSAAIIPGLTPETQRRMRRLLRATLLAVRAAVRIRRLVIATTNPVVPSIRRRSLLFVKVAALSPNRKKTTLPRAQRATSKQPTRLFPSAVQPDSSQRSARMSGSTDEEPSATWHRHDAQPASPIPVSPRSRRKSSMMQITRFLKRKSSFARQPKSRDRGQADGTAAAGGEAKGGTPTRKHLEAGAAVEDRL